MKAKHVQKRLREQIENGLLDYADQSKKAGWRNPGRGCNSLAGLPYVEHLQWNCSPVPDFAGRAQVNACFHATISGYES